MGKCKIPTSTQNKNLNMIKVRLKFKTQISYNKINYYLTLKKKINLIKTATIMITKNNLINL